MSDEYLFGYEAMKPLLKALGIDIDAKTFALQHITLELPHDHFPTLYIQCAPDSTLFEDEEALKALEGANVFVSNEGFHSFAVIERIVRREISRLMQEGVYVPSIPQGKLILKRYEDRLVIEFPKKGELKLAKDEPMKIDAPDSLDIRAIVREELERVFLSVRARNV